MLCCAEWGGRVGPQRLSPMQNEGHTALYKEGHWRDQQENRRQEEKESGEGMGKRGGKQEKVKKKKRRRETETERMNAQLLRRGNERKKDMIEYFGSFA